MSLPVSIFNDVIGPVMRGPSSSHCAAALRIGRICRDLVGGDLQELLVQFDRKGSLPTTHESQGSDMGLFGGLLGWEAADERLPDSATALQEAGTRVRFEYVDAGDPHPNTYRLTLQSRQGRHFVRAISTGGGMIEILEIDGFQVRLFGDWHVTLVYLDGRGGDLRRRLAERGFDRVQVHEAKAGELVLIEGTSFVDDDLLAGLAEGLSVRRTARLGPVLPVPSYEGMSVPFTSCAEMLATDAGRDTPLWRLAVDYESARGGLTEREVVDRMAEIVRILRTSIRQGIAGTEHPDRILGHQSGRFLELQERERLLDAGALNRIVGYVSALMEVKSAMGVIVAAPTAGACAALPAAVIGMAEERGGSEEDMAKAMLAAGLIGVFIATPWTFAAEVGGCQAEGGAAACMAAAALVTMAGGSLRQAVGASSMAMQNMLGLICDPVASRVEIPCLGKNVMAASNAVSCANLALADYDPVIPLDEVIAAAKAVSTQMPRELRCTALGGLAATPTARALEQELAARKAGCGSCGTGTAGISTSAPARSRPACSD